MSHVLVIPLAALLTAAGAMGATAVVSRRLGRLSVVDVTWGLVFVAIAWVTYAVGTHSARSLVLAVLVTAWGARLAWHIRRRALGGEEDPRYARLVEGVPEHQRFRFALRRVFAVQGLVAWVVSLPLQVAAATDRPLGWVAAAGVVVYLLGVTFEVVGDAQLAAFRADPATRGTVLDRGLWAWTRHPNYFGDSALWWGLWLIAAEAWPGVLTVVSPVVMTYVLAFATGARLLENQMAERPGYRDYMERTPMFLPRPPRRRPTG
jgi:steroid 5-alpha reductase family enzyme